LFEKIDQGVRGASVFIACISDAATKSKSCQQEVALASELGKPIIPVWVASLRSWPPPGPMSPVLAGKMYIDLGHGEFNTGVSGLIRAVKEIM